MFSFGRLVAIRREGCATVQRHMRQARRHRHLCGAAAAACAILSINHSDKRLRLEVTEATLRRNRGGNDWVSVEGLAEELLRFQCEHVKVLI